MKTATQIVRVVRQVKANRSRVFRAWTDADELKKWCAPEGLTVSDAQVDLRVGGSYRIEMRAPDGAMHTATGTYREIAAPARLVFTWQWQKPMDGEEGETVVTVELNERAGQTEVVLIHEGFASESGRDNHEKGWTSCTNRLVGLFES